MKFWFFSRNKQSSAKRVLLPIKRISAMTHLQDPMITKTTCGNLVPRDLEKQVGIRFDELHSEGHILWQPFLSENAVEKGFKVICFFAVLQDDTPPRADQHQTSIQDLTCYHPGSIPNSTSSHPQADQSDRFK